MSDVEEKKEEDVRPVFNGDDYIASWGLDPSVAVYRSQSRLFDVRYLKMVDDFNPVINDDLVFQFGMVLPRVETGDFEWTDKIGEEYKEMWDRFYRFVNEAEIPCINERADRWDESIEFVYPPQGANGSRIIVRVASPSDPASFDVVQVQPHARPQYIYFPLHGQHIKLAPYHEIKFLKYDEVPHKPQHVRFIRQRQFALKNPEEAEIIYNFRIVWVGAESTDIMSGEVRPHYECSVIARPKWSQEFDRVMLLLSCLEKIMDMQGRFLEVASFAVASDNMKTLADAIKAHLIPS